MCYMNRCTCAFPLPWRKSFAPWRGRTVDLSVPVGIRDVSPDQDVVTAECSTYWANRAPGWKLGKKEIYIINCITYDINQTHSAKSTSSLKKLDPYRKIEDRPQHIASFHCRRLYQYNLSTMKGRCYLRQ